MNYLFKVQRYLQNYLVVIYIRLSYLLKIYPYCLMNELNRNGEKWFLSEHKCLGTHAEKHWVYY